LKLKRRRDFNARCCERNGRIRESDKRKKETERERGRERDRTFLAPRKGPPRKTKEEGQILRARNVLLAKEVINATQ